MKLFGEPYNSKLWENPIVREWLICNIQQDEKEEEDKFKLLLGVINPKLFDEFKKPDFNKIMASAPSSNKNILNDIDKERVNKSINSHKSIHQRLLEEDNVSLNPNDEKDGIDAGASI